ncbi:MAG: Lrp/AsnC ligand binding domain-containing protein [Haloferacaceae archaeon]
MVVAYVLVEASTGEADRIAAAMRAVDGVESVHVVAGDVDFVVRVRVDSPAAVRAAVVSAITGIDGVENTRTYLAMDA